MPYTHDIGIEFWFQFDHAFLPNSAPVPVLQAYAAIGGPDQPRIAWEQARAANAYPAQFITYAEPVKDSIAFLAVEQRRVFDQFFPADIVSLRLAFEDFGQGVLFDDRRPVGDKLHKMDTGFSSPPIGYHRWHPFIRAHALTGGDQAYWLEVDRLVGLAWAIQSIARPVPDKPDNPRLPQDVLDQLRLNWMGATFDDLDIAFDSSPFPIGI